jgi:hypothetical protein
MSRVVMTCHLPSLGKGKAKGPTNVDKAKIYLALLTGDEATFQAVAGPIFARIGKTMVAIPRQLNRYQKSVTQAVEDGDEAVIAVLKAGGIEVVPKATMCGGQALEMVHPEPPKPLDIPLTPEQEADLQDVMDQLQKPIADAKEAEELAAAQALHHTAEVADVETD